VPDSRFKADLRSQLVSITSRIIAESAADAIEAEPGRPAARKPLPVVAGAFRSLRKPVLTFASAAAVLVAMLGLALWVSNGSLPGQSLYGVKRASENVRLSLAANDVDKGRAYLDLASKRADEAIQLVGKPTAMAFGGGPVAAGRISDRTASLVTDTLNSADTDSRSGSQLLGKSAVARMSADPLAKLGPWVPAQRARLTDLLGRVPAGPLHDRINSSISLVNRIGERATRLTARIGCSCLSQAVSDDLGPIPCNNCAPLPGSSGPTSGNSAPGPSSHPSGRSGAPSSGTAPRSGSGAGSGSAGSGSAGSGGGAGGSGGGAGGSGSGGGVGGVGGIGLPGGSSGGSGGGLPVPGGTSAAGGLLPSASLGTGGAGVSVSGVGGVGVGSSGPTASLSVPHLLP
jgi:uncharacterized membrane protein YgcG